MSDVTLRGRMIESIARILPRAPRLCAFYFVLAAQLIPIWAFQYLPTQDGPSHVANAVILKDYHAPDRVYQEYFVIVWAPFPNWTTAGALCGLMEVCKPLTAEKLLVSMYVLAFGVGFRYFLAAFGPERVGLSSIGLLFVFNRCFFLGFYNYCLSIALLWFVFGFCLRRQASPLCVRNACFLIIAFTAAYFTHLAGFLLCSLAALAATLGLRWRAAIAYVVQVALAAFPAFYLTVKYLTATGRGFDAPWSLGSTVGGIFTRFRENGTDFLLGRLSEINSELLGLYEDRMVAGSIIQISLIAIAALVVWGCVAASRDAPKLNAPRTPTAVLAGVVALAYCSTPERFGNHGGYLPSRLCFLPLLFLIPFLRLPASRLGRQLLHLIAIGMVAVQLTSVCGYFAQANRELTEYAAGISYTGSNRTLRAATSGHSYSWANPLLHAVDYYCLTSGNIDLDDYEATLEYFPTRFRFQSGAGDEALDSPSPDILIMFGDSEASGIGDPPRYHLLFQQRRLRAFGKND